MSISNPNKTINKIELNCGEKADVNISFNAKSELKARPADIILLIDNSSSMGLTLMDEAKKGANDLIDLVTVASGGVLDESIENSRVGVVSFSSQAYKLADLTGDTKALKTAINSIRAGGSTNHESAFSMALSMIDEQSTNDKIVVLFTDGVSTTGGDANVQANLIKGKGGEIFCMAYGSDRSQIDLWASDPLDRHVATTTDPNKIEEVFKEIAYELIKAGAKNINIVERVDDNLEIVNIKDFNPGIATIVDKHTINWDIDVIGVTDMDMANLSFEVKSTSKEDKTINVNNSLTYKDRDNNTVVFPNPTIKLNGCSIIVVPDCCKNFNQTQIEGCVDAKEVITNETSINNIGRIVQVSVPIKNVCPNKRVALGVILTEIDFDGIEHKRGMQTVLINPTQSDGCEDVLVQCVNFVVPEEIDVIGNKGSLCNNRNFKVRVMANYIDNDFIQCDTDTVTIK